ncbi:MAG: ABC transporter ATP-binding protein [Ignavibacteria bacterium]
MTPVIQVENLSKLYRLGVITSGTVAQDFNRLIAKVRGKEDPYQKVGSVNNRLLKKDNSFVWALKDVSLQINKSEIVGIIGRNGAGKSTLLKILSRVTSPTKGIVRINGRIASLLEVGTGFHQDLTGGENIFLNGSILGMTKSEIKSKFDEIVDFSGIGNYVNTPVKRYSSGMYVRLAFAVAAHLEPEILIVDEVLAVGDAEFQKKCIGKMQEVSKNDGRTVIFVSHNMGAINNLCTSCIMLENGKVKLSGETKKIVSAYLANDSENGTVAEFFEEMSEAHFTKISITTHESIDPSGDLDVRMPFLVNFWLKVRNFVSGLGIAFSVYSKNGTKVFYSSERIDKLFNIENSRSDILHASAEVPGMFLAPGDYFINASIQIENVQLFDLKENVVNFTIAESGSGLSKFKGKDIGLVLADFKWKNNLS